ncbi:uncharacterized protein N7500_000175 [Penicillium coprophilum]|nr:uncharacterized protein N7500_000175 [Penicillium coprophilum]KAJ5177476.1 hypothetical protein N7500_000175 [Penicillium coprophilum]
MVREIVDLLLQKRGTTPVLSFSKRYNYERAKYKDPKIITEWFNLV